MWIAPFFVPTFVKRGTFWGLFAPFGVPFGANPVQIIGAYDAR